MRVSTKTALAAFALAALAGCETMSREDCLYADWGRIGFDDGAAGRDLGALARRREQCRKFNGLKSDDAAYLAGRADGLARYCTPGNGYREGRDGARYEGVCPAESAGSFLAAYNEGREVYLALERYRRIEGDIFELERALAELRDRSRRLRESLVADAEMSREERADIAARLGRIDDQREAIRRRLGFLASELAQASADLAVIRARAAGLYAG